MKKKINKLFKLMFVNNRFERIRLLLEIRLNYLLSHRNYSGYNAMNFNDFLIYLSIKDSELFNMIKLDGESEKYAQWIFSKFNETIKDINELPLPVFYNADKSLAILSYGLVRHLRPNIVLETGVGYGITSALVLLAMEHNNSGTLISIDLPALSDPYGSYTGLVVSKCLKTQRWNLHFGSSRYCLPKVLSNTEKVDLFISDSANVYTLQRYEFETIFPHLSAGGAALFNNVSAKFQTFLQSVKGVQLYSIWQVEKPLCITGLILKK